MLEEQGLYAVPHNNEHTLTHKSQHLTVRSTRWYTNVGASAACAGLYVQQLAEYFRAAGWSTLGVTGNHNLNQDPLQGNPQGGIGRGWHFEC